MARTREQLNAHQKERYNSDPIFKAKMQERNLQARHRRKATIEGSYGMHRSRAKQKGHSFDLTLEQFAEYWQQPCYYSGHAIKTIGLDRIDSSKGYEIGNIRACCTRCNSMKLNLNEDDWYEHMKQILEHMNKKEI